MDEPTFPPDASEPDAVDPPIPAEPENADHIDPAAAPPTPPTPSPTPPPWPAWATWPDRQSQTPADDAQAESPVEAASPRASDPDPAYSPDPAPYRVPLEEFPPPAAPTEPPPGVYTSSPILDRRYPPSPVPSTPEPRGYPADGLSPKPPDPTLPLYGYKIFDDADRPPKPRSRLGTAAIAISAGLLGAIAAVALLLVTGVLSVAADTITDTEAVNAAPAVVDRVTTEIVSPEGQSIDLAAAVGRKVIPSIVAVEVGIRNIEGLAELNGSGSGVIFTSDGLIVTNEHVVVEGTFTQVVLTDGRVYEAEVVGMDALTDLAVLRINAVGLTPIELGTVDDLEIGDTAIAVGNPLGLQGGPSLTVGVISAFDREVTTAGDPSPLFGMIQTDAPFTRGSSGGALVDGSGRLIGITTAIGVSDAGAEGIGFATPVDLVTRITDEIIETGFVIHAFLGIEGRDFFEDLSDGARAPHGAEVVRILDGSAAGPAGILPGDQIIGYDGNDVRTMQDLVNGLRRYRVGDSVQFRFIRSGDVLFATIELGERPEGI